MKSPITLPEQKKIIEPLVHKLIAEHRLHPQEPMIVGIQGGQGTGKSTMSIMLEESLKSNGFQVHHFSLDDFYTTALKRGILRKRYSGNAFYEIVRGMPGTHDLKLLSKVLHSIKLGKPFSLPIFDKSLHDGEGDPISKTIEVRGRQDFVIFEGWCVGIPTISSPKFIALCYKYHLDLRSLDPTLKDHKVVLDFITMYQPLWKMLDYTIMLRPPTPAMHKLWRNQAEMELKRKKHEGMSSEQISHFVDVFLPCTYMCYDLIKPDCLISVNDKHTFSKISFV